MNDFELPVTRYAQSGDVNIAYQTMGEGPIDLIVVPGIVSHVEFAHEFPGYTNWLRRLAKFARVVTFDKRGAGALGSRPRRLSAGGTHGRSECDHARHWIVAGRICSDFPRARR